MERPAVLAPDSAAQALHDAWLDAERPARRLLRLRFPHGDAPPGAALVPERLDACEALSRDFEFDVEVLCERCDLAAADLLGKLVALDLHRGDATLRHFTGHVFEFAFVERVDDAARYRLRLRPWLAFLRLGRASRIFHGLSVAEQTAAVLGHYPMGDWRAEALSNDAVMTDAVQYDESDYNYLHRRWEDLGWHYRYEHRADGHRLVLGDDSRACPGLDGDARLLWQGAVGLAHRGLSAFAPERRLAASRYAARTFDFKRSAQPLASSARGAAPQPADAEVYDWLGAYAHPDAAAGQDLARLRIEEIEAAAERFVGCGDDDRLEAGRRFVLAVRDGVPGGGSGSGSGSADEEFVIVEARHRVVNHLHAGDARADYGCDLAGVRRSVPWRPGRGRNSTTPRIDAPQTATVVGSDSADIDTDRWGRVHLQFHWDRDGAHDERSSAWVRVASAWAGAEQGFIGLPRIGSEVVVQFLGGCVDRPLVTGALYNERHLPPWRLPGQHALSGLRSRELGGAGNAAGGRSNHLVLDDSAERIQAQLRSDHQASQLSLGHIGRIDDAAGRQDDRGQGYELRTDGQGVHRAGQGLLVSTEARPQGRGAMAERAEALDGLGQAATLHEHLGAAAQQAGAHDAGDQDAVTEAMRAQTAELAEQPQPSAFQRPHLVLDSAAGLHTRSRGSTHQASAAHHAVTSGAHTSLSAGQSLLASAKQAVRLFAQRAGMRLVAAAGDIDLKALSHSVNVLAKLDITHTAERITLSAREEVVINGGGSTTRWSAAGIHQATAGSWRAKAAAHRMEGPDNAPRPELPQAVKGEDLKAKASLAFVLRSHAAGGRVFAHQPYELHKEGALVEKGVTDEHGQLIVKDHQPGTTRYAVKLSNGHEFELPVKPQLDARDEHLAAQGYRAVQDRVEDRLRRQRGAEGV